MLTFHKTYFKDNMIESLIIKRDGNVIAYTEEEITDRSIAFTVDLTPTIPEKNTHPKDIDEVIKAVKIELQMQQGILELLEILKGINLPDDQVITHTDYYWKGEDLTLYIELPTNFVITMFDLDEETK